MDCRLDTGEIQSYRETPEGFLDLYCTFSKVGDLKYQYVDGSEITETLTADELFNSDSLATITGKPITLNHPPDWVTAENAKEYSRGATGTRVITKEDTAQVVASIHDKELIELIKNKKARQVSVGYTTDVVKKDDGKFYQTARKYNHLAVLTTDGRAGDRVRVHYNDSTAALLVGTSPSDVKEDPIPTSKTDKKSDLEIVSALESKLEKDSGLIKGIVESAFARFSDRVDSLTKLIEGSIPKVPEENKQTEDKTDSKAELEKIRTDAFQAGRDRATLESTAKEYLKDFKFDSASNDDIKTAVIKHLRPEISSRLDGKDANYIHALYDITVEEEKNKDSTVGLKNGGRGVKTEEKDAETIAREGYLQRLKGGK